MIAARIVVKIALVGYYVFLCCFCKRFFLIVHVIQPFTFAWHTRRRWESSAVVALAACYILPSRRADANRPYCSAAHEYRGKSFVLWSQWADELERFSTIE